MGRPRRDDPASVPDRVNLVADPERVAELVAEFNRKLAYIEEQYLLAQRDGFDRQSFNRSLARLRAALKKPAPAGTPETRLHPLFELAISIEARKIAGLPPDAPLLSEHAPLVRDAARGVANRAKGLRGLPANDLLRFYVVGLIALFEETTGKRVRAQRDKDSVYDPRVAGPPGQAMRALVDRLEPGISDSTLWYWVREARRQNGGKPLRFRDLYPGYGAAFGPGAELRLQSPYEAERFLGASVPIYCPSRAG